jgi:DNA-binding NarL/FixJ family response regulator
MMPDGSGIEWARLLKTDRPEISIIFVTASDSEGSVAEAISIGAEGYVVKNSSSERLVDAIRTVSSGDYIYYPALTLPLIRKTFENTRKDEGPGSQHSIEGLSHREMQVASLVSQGLTYREIAETVDVSINTVKTHVQRIYKRLGVSSRRELTKRYFA